ncbi:YggS family pyridoxal phosphate-dependent enzyme [Aquirufa rosea]|uniref:Pyridoxal phosphate homeostasis protein n=1 Tax=Aquirufa rosea TaxID=2509241 RepID=A0A4Q1C195_9BACT|nr:YggS family pyridoxal phosphate-dependent enzyme [Aquirufa rosea]RXK50876.1 YggS family pyridoxal phosphate-dependent enzyme [Aquirufa rosea]
MSIAQHIANIQAQLQGSQAKLIAVTKTRSIAELQATYEAGIKDFGENRVQEMVEKQAQLASDIRWHQIGHLQTNKVKYIAPFVHLIHSVDSFRLLKEIDSQGKKNGRIISCLFQMYIAQEESKFGLSKEELLEILASPEFASLSHIRIQGLMGMASFTENDNQIAKEFSSLKELFDELQGQKIAYQTGLVEWKELSMGMSGDYLLAAKLGSTMVRVGSAIYGARS